MNKKQLKAIELAEQIRDTEHWKRTEKSDMIFGVLALASWVDAGRRELDTIWRKLNEEKVA